MPVRAFLLIECVAFACAAAVHAGLLGAAYAHDAARNAESLIAVVLLGGLIVSMMRPASTRRAGLLAQGFALALTCVGIGFIVVGMGPQTVGDIVYHVGIVIFLIYGMVVAARPSAVAA